MSNSLLRRIASRNQFRKVLTTGLVSAFCIGLTTIQTNTAFGQEPKEVQQQKTSVVVLTDQAGSEKLLDELRKKLEFLPEEQRDKILDQVKKSLDQAPKSDTKQQRVVVATVDADGNLVTKNGNKVTMMTIVQSTDGKDIAKKEGLGQVFGNSIFVPGNPIQSYEVNQTPKFRIGLSVVNPEDSDSEEGLVIERVMEDSPAAEAGIEEGDVIIAIDGEEAEGFSTLQEAVQEAGEADRSVKLKLQRDGKEMTIKIKPTKSEDQAGMTFKVMPQAGSILPADMLPMEAGGGFGLAIPSPIGMPDLSETKEEIAALKEEIQELKAMVKKLLDSAEKR